MIKNHKVNDTEIEKKNFITKRYKTADFSDNENNKIEKIVFQSVYVS